MCSWYWEAARILCFQEPVFSLPHRNDLVLEAGQLNDDALTAEFSRLYAATQQVIPKVRVISLQAIPPDRLTNYTAELLLRIDLDQKTARSARLGAPHRLLRFAQRTSLAISRRGGRSGGEFRSGGPCLGKSGVLLSGRPGSDGRCNGLCHEDISYCPFHGYRRQFRSLRREIGFSQIASPAKPRRCKCRMRFSAVGKPPPFLSRLISIGYTYLLFLARGMREREKKGVSHEKSKIRQNFPGRTRPVASTLASWCSITCHRSHFPLAGLPYLNTTSTHSYGNNSRHYSATRPAGGTALVYPLQFLLGVITSSGGLGLVLTIILILVLFNYI